MKHWLVLAAVGLAIAAWMFRWSEPVFLGDRKALTIDRLTGQWWYIDNDDMLPVEKVERWKPPTTDQRK